MTGTGAKTAGPSCGPLLAITGLYKSFGGVPAVDGVSFSVETGEVVGLIGPNGSGKSTTVNVISGALRSDAGRVVIAGDDVTNQPAYRIARQGVIRTFQIPRVWGRLTVTENLLVAGTARQNETITRALSRRRNLRAHQVTAEGEVARTLDTLRLTALADRHAEVLSGGQKRLLEFGRIMMSGPRVLVLDEPFAGVDPVMIGQLQDVIRGFQDRGCAVILVEHNLRAVGQTCDRVMVMVTGKIIATGTLAEVRTSEHVVSAYLGGPG
jgi:branched-chain amino acid transport system ATP-binding protein